MMSKTPPNNAYVNLFTERMWVEPAFLTYEIESGCSPFFLTGQRAGWCLVLLQHFQLFHSAHNFVPSLCPGSLALPVRNRDINGPLTSKVTLFPEPIGWTSGPGGPRALPWNAGQFI